MIGIPPFPAHEKTALCLDRAVNSVGWQSIFSCFYMYPFVNRRYGCYITNESPETYVLYPTWICDCDYIGDPKEKINVSAYNIEKDFNKKYTFKTLVINAQTGEMDDPYLSKKEQIFCPMIITWEDAQ